MLSFGFTLATLLFVAIVTSSSALTDVQLDHYYREFNPPAVHEFEDPYGGTILCVKKSVLDPLHVGPSKPDPLVFKNNQIDSCPDGTIQVPKISRQNVGSYIKALELKERSSRLHLKHTSSSNAQRYRFDSTSTPSHDNNAAAFPPEGEDPAAPPAEGEYPLAPPPDEEALPPPPTEGENPPPPPGEEEPPPPPEEYPPAPSPKGQYIPPDGVPPNGELGETHERNNYQDSCYNFACSNAFPEESLRSTRPDSEGDRRVVKNIAISKGLMHGSDGPLAWFIYVDDVMQGYIPCKFFPQRLGIAGYADEVQFGGEVTWNKTDSQEPHTPTDMGNGYYGSIGEKRASSILNIKVFDAPIDNEEFNTSPLIDYVTQGGCYTSTWGTSSSQPSRFVTYGGPGFQTDNCP